ncbi:uncharacterized protein PHACADRAFT_262611 [Phanerochaete carnosa HHB-10118-sp]|uniref:Uncharacterized protein n=1 Tax=Phanerochaete carnosa (strain HHB-10118-sp) TaxID=650164 RepID=K5WP61_PHACS|nr:uncharacterized protein PHACADRAFT_262611 [Phanerochaete carnosa HHB-10118-sp]EKM52127.1 hypothetical protein PHACADRAFT_262611 [Phanerochaete carnosa HHB-10118-sp]
MASTLHLSDFVYPQAANLIAFAPLPAIITRTALTGGASFLDTFFLVPGILSQQDAVKVNDGEYPATAAMTSGYVFRVENQATVAFLQRVGKTGHLVDVDVYKTNDLSHIDPIASLSYLAGISSTMVVAVLLVAMKDYAALMFLGTLMAARFLNVVVIKRRATLGWKGVKEPGQMGDLMILASQDRWIRMRGTVDDLKEVTAGSWLQEMQPLDSFLACTASLLMYGSMAFAWKASALGSILTAGLLVLSSALLGICNSTTTKLRMFGCVVGKTGETPYARRRDMADDILKQTQALGYEDNSWAVRLGLVTEIKQDKKDVKSVIL